MIYTPVNMIDDVDLQTTGNATYSLSSALPTNVCAIVKEIVACNVGPTAATFSVETSVAKLFKTVSLQPGETKIYSLSTVLMPDDTLSVVGSINDYISMRVSGIEVTS